MSVSSEYSLLIVIVNYRTAGLVIDCLRSLEGEVGTVAGGARVVVADNASGDGSVARLTAALAEHGWGVWAKLLPLECNGGYAAGNNAAIRPALQAAERPRYVLLLNPDTIVRPGALMALVAFMDSRPDVGLAGSRMEHPDGTPQRSAFRFPTVLGEFEGAVRFGPVSRLLARWIIAPPVPEGPRPTDWVAGASLIVRREVFEAIGLLDEGFFMYYEEVDFCRRALLAGWPCWYVPSSRVVHLVGQSSGVTSADASRRRRPAYWFQSRRRYLRRHLGAARTVLADLAWTVGFALYRLRRAVQRLPDNDPQRLLHDFIAYNFLSLGRSAKASAAGPARS
jgi:N-acetylglucosaminyl-diphospho-decaprenol L-rhamnosyltransferase